MKQEYIPDAMLLLSHSMTALVASMFHHLIDPYPKWIKVALLLLYLSFVYVLYRISQKVLKGRLDQGLRGEVDALQNELAAQTRYNLLRSRMLEAVAEFIKERYQISYDLNKKLQKLREVGSVNVKTVTDALKEADKSRVELVKETLKSLSSALREDIFKRPQNADDANRDHMKVSFYAVEQDPDAPPDKPDQKALVPKARAYPNEGSPKTRKFQYGEGVAGEVWKEGRVIICEHGGKEQRFREMRPGQKSEYASMICVPTILDVPGYKLTEFYGVLTVDSPIREGYFVDGTDEFWADLLQPICNILIYARDSSRLIVTLNEIVQDLGGQTTQSAAATP